MEFFSVSLVNNRDYDQHDTHVEVGLIFMTPILNFHDLCALLILEIKCIFWAHRAASHVKKSQEKYTES